MNTDTDFYCEPYYFDKPKVYLFEIQHNVELFWQLRRLTKLRISYENKIYAPAVYVWHMNGTPIDMGWRLIPHAVNDNSVLCLDNKGRVSFDEWREYILRSQMNHIYKPGHFICPQPCSCPLSAKTEIMVNDSDWDWVPIKWLLNSCEPDTITFNYIVTHSRTRNYSMIYNYLLSMK